MDRSKPEGRKVKPVYMVGITAAAIVVIALVAITYAQPTVKVGDTIEVNYTGSFTNGTVFGSSAQIGPFNFTVGANQVIPGFDQAVVGMSAGQEKNVTIQPSEAYGFVNQSLIIDVPANTFTSQNVVVGERVTNAAIGRHGVITAVNTNTLTIDFNPLLAGKTLVFKITVLKIVKTG